MMQVPFVYKGFNLIVWRVEHKWQPATEWRKLVSVPPKGQKLKLCLFRDKGGVQSYAPVAILTILGDI